MAWMQQSDHFTVFFLLQETFSSAMVLADLCDLQKCISVALPSAALAFASSDFCKVW